MITYAPIPRPARAPSPTTAIISRMAEDMREMAFGGENVNEDSLRGRGYTQPVIKRFSMAAARVAARRSVRQVADT